MYQEKLHGGVPEKALKLSEHNVVNLALLCIHVTAHVTLASHPLTTNYAEFVLMRVLAFQWAHEAVQARFLLMLQLSFSPSLSYVRTLPKPSTSD